MHNDWQIAPLTAENWSDFETLFGANGACGGCWCMNWRISSSDFNANKGDGNKQLMKEKVDQGTIPGLLLYLHNTVAGWISLEERKAFDYFRTTRTLQAVDDQPVLVLSCMFLRKDLRKQGLSTHILKLVIQWVKQHNPMIIEAYPYHSPSKQADAFIWSGKLSAFLAAGFEIIEERGARTIVRAIHE